MAKDLYSALIPSPQHMETKGEVICLAADLYLTINIPAQWIPNCFRAVHREIAEICHLTGAKQLIQKRSGTLGWVVLRDKPYQHDVPEGYIRALQQLPAESYIIDTQTPPGVYAWVVAADVSGFYYGLGTLKQLLQVEPGCLPQVYITDYPDFAIRAVHVHGFDKGYGAGDLCSLQEYRTELITYFDTLAQARFNMIALHMDAGWIVHGDTWVEKELSIDDTLTAAIAAGHDRGLHMQIEVRLSAQTKGSSQPDFHPLNPLQEWPEYEAALCRVLRWHPDSIVVSCNDLGPLTDPDIIATYGCDGRFSGALMAELLEKAAAVIRQGGSQAKLYLLPRFYAPVHWQRHPNVVEDLWRMAPSGVVMTTTAWDECRHPVIVKVEEQYGAQFMYWVNYTSNHGKELRTILSHTEQPDLTPLLQAYKQADRRIILNLGYPVEPQYVVTLAAGDWLWNMAAFSSSVSLEKAARKLYNPNFAQLLVKYARLLDYAMLVASLGGEAARLINFDDSSLQEVVTQWQGYLERARTAAQIAIDMGQMSMNEREVKLAQILYWNARRVETDCQVGLELAVARVEQRPVRKNVVEVLLEEHRQILRNHYPVPKNDPKNAEVCTRGIRAIEQCLLSGSANQAYMEDEDRALRRLP